MTIHRVSDADIDELARFFATLSERDLTFIREDLSDHATFAPRVTDEMRWIHTDDSGISGYVAVERLPGWSSHVGELRLVVSPKRRGMGLGRTLAWHAVAAAVSSGIRKIVVELATDQEGAVAMFSRLGFTGEALLRDHIRDRDGKLRDLIILAHDVS